MTMTPVKPLIQFLAVALAEIRDVTLWSVWVALPAALLSWAFGWAYSVDNIDYVRVVLSAIATDHVFGTISHLWFKRDFSILKNIGGLAIKILVVLLMGSLFDGLTILVIKEDFIYRYLLLVTRLLVFLYPAMSAMKNCHIITGGVFPPKMFMMKSLKFTETMDIKVFKTEDTTTTTTTNTTTETNKH